MIVEVNKNLSDVGIRLIKNYIPTFDISSLDMLCYNIEDIMDAVEVYENIPFKDKEILEDLKGKDIEFIYLDVYEKEESKKIINQSI